MRLLSFSAQGYRSLRTIHLELGQVGLFAGENGVGKSNLYRALQLLKAAASGILAREIAREGGMQAVLWAGPRRTGTPARIVIEACFEDEETAVRTRYRVECGLPPPASAGFAFEPHVKEETVAVDSGRRMVDMMQRKGPAVFARDSEGRRAEHPVRMLNSETALSALGTSGRYPEVGDIRAALLSWRFYHGFRTDRYSPVRKQALAVTAPLLEEDGSNLAAVFATLKHIKGDTQELDRCVSAAFNGAQLEIPPPGEEATFGLVLPEFPRRLFGPKELSDGQIRFLALAGALLSYRLPELIALNEPETSLHPSMLPALADMIAAAAATTQVWTVTHSAELAKLIRDRTGTRPLTVAKHNGATVVGSFADDGDLGEDET